MGDLEVPMRCVAVLMTMCAVAQAEPSADQINAVKSDPKQMRVVFGAAVCYCQRIRKDALAELAKERKYSAEAGVANLERRDQLKTRLRWTDEAEAVYRGKLKKWKGLTAAPCSDATVKRIIVCKVEAGDNCADEIGVLSAFIDDAPGLDEP
jgi:hypothetical protein